MYLGMLAVIPQDDGSLALTHDGTKYKDVALDYVVEMVQFRQEDILSAVAERGELTPEIIDQVSATCWVVMTFTGAAFLTCPFNPP